MVAALHQRRAPPRPARHEPHAARRVGQAGDELQQCRLPRSARTGDDDRLARCHPERQRAEGEVGRTRRVGFVGELHPRWRQQWELPHTPLLFELDLDAVTARRVPGGPLLIHKLVEARYRIMGANVRYTDGRDVEWIPNDTIITRGEFRIGVIGISTRASPPAVL